MLRSLRTKSQENMPVMKSSVCPWFKIVPIRRLIAWNTMVNAAMIDEVEQDASGRNELNHLIYTRRDRHAANTKGSVLEPNN